MDHPTLPLTLNTPEFRRAWDEYIAFRREAKFRKLLPSTVQRRWDMLASWGHDAAIAAINEAMTHQYQGIFPPKGMPAKRGGSEFSGAF